MNIFVFSLSAKIVVLSLVRQIFVEYLKIVYENSFPHNLLRTDRKLASLRKAFTIVHPLLAKNNISSRPWLIKVYKTQISKIIKPGGFVGRLLAPLLKVHSPLMKNELTRIPVELTAAASLAVAWINKTILEFRATSNE